MEAWRDAITDPPTEEGEYIVCRIDDDEVTSAIYNPEDTGKMCEWTTIEEYFDLDDVVAWMPMPKPPQNTKYAAWEKNTHVIKSLQAGMCYQFEHVGYICSNCDYKINELKLFEAPRVCPQCGRKMINVKEPI